MAPVCHADGTEPSRRAVVCRDGWPRPTGLAPTASPLRCLAVACVCLRHGWQAHRCSGEGRRQRGDREPGAQRPAGRVRGHPQGRAHRPRRARLRAPDQAAGRAGPAGRASSSPSCRTRSSRPSPTWSAASLAQQGLTPVLCTHTAGGCPRPTTSTCCSSSTCRASLFAGGNYSGQDGGARALPGPHRPQAAHRARQRRASTSCRSPGCPATTPSPPTRRAGTSSRSGTRGSG